MKLILGLVLLLGAIPFVTQDPPNRPSQTTSDGTALTSAQNRAMIELNEAARAYREGNFGEAQQHTEAAQALDPSNKTASYFLARIIHRQYKPGDQSSENISKAYQAIDAYRRMLRNEPQNEEAYTAIASLYGLIKQDELQRQWILERAVDARFSSEKRAEAYVILASKDWHCSNEITDLPTNKTARIVRNRAMVRYKKPEDEAEFQRAKRCLASGLEEIESAIMLSPESEMAWSYKTNLLIEAAKLAEMDGRPDMKTDLERQVAEAQRRTEELHQKQKAADPGKEPPQ